MSRKRPLKMVGMSLILILCASGLARAECPSADLTGDCRVDLEDFAVMASQWLDEPDPCEIYLVWVYIDDPGVSGHEGFTGHMSKYETTNAQYCQYLNAALADSLITVYNDVVYAVSDTGHSEPYFETYVADSYSQIIYSGGSFSVRRRDGYDMSNYPVTDVSWYGATGFCDYYGYRLPTEWEWQAVADFDGTFTYGCGTTIDHSKANYNKENPLGLSSYPYTSPVNYYSSFGYGMNDMAGNVWEWTSTSDGSFRVNRGGGWYYTDYYCTVSLQGYGSPFSTGYGIGFRPVLDLQTPPDMVPISGGEFQMGDHFNEGYRRELPVHSVYLDSFYMGSCEITNRQYCDFLNSADVKVNGGIVYASFDTSNIYRYCNTHSYDAGSQIDYSGGVFSVRTKGGRNMSNDPMVRVSWYGSVAYCNWRSQQEGKEQCYNLSTWACDFSKKGYRLATEAEWEYAARGGLSGRRFPWGDTISHSQANYYSEWSGVAPYYSYDVNPTEGYHPTWNDGIRPYTSPVGGFSPNGYGLYNMSGNVWEWCNDWYDEDYYDVSPYDNPTGPGSGIYRVLRGGGWDFNPAYCRVAYRYYYGPSNRHDTSGFRLSLDLN